MSKHDGRRDSIILKWDNLKINIKQLIFYGYYKEFEKLFLEIQPKHHMGFMLNHISYLTIDHRIEYLKLVLNQIYNHMNKNFNNSSSSINSKKEDIDIKNNTNFYFILNLTIQMSSKNGSLEIIKYIFERFCRNQIYVEKNIQQLFDYHVFDGAASSGNLELVKFLHHTVKTPIQFSIEAINQAAINGHLEVVQWLHENRSEGCSPYALNGSSSNGHLSVVKFLVENHTEFHENLDTAINLSMLMGHHQTSAYLSTFKKLKQQN